MKILFLCRRPFNEIVGGVAEYLHYLPIALKTLDIESLSYTAGESYMTGPNYLSNGMPAYSGPYLKPGLFSFTRKLNPLFDFCRQQKIDVVHAQGVYRSGYVAMQIFKKTGIPYVLTSHSDILTTNSERMQREKIQRRCREILKNASAVIHLTSLMADASHQILETKEKNYIIGNGVDLSEWQSVIGLPEQDYMLAIGRLEKGKGFNVLIDAYAELFKQGIKTSLIIAGDGADKVALQTQARQHNLNVVTDFQNFSNIPEKSVIFTGYVKGETKKRLFTQSKIILFATQPSTWQEAFSIVQVEAMAAGKLMIASDTESTRYLQSLGLQATLVKADDIFAWSSEIKKLLENDELRLQTGELNLTNSQQFDWKIVAKQHQEVYSTLARK